MAILIKSFRKARKNLKIILDLRDLFYYFNVNDQSWLFTQQDKVGNPQPHNVSPERLKMQ
jgi:hypothetical protein